MCAELLPKLYRERLPDVIHHLMVGNLHGLNPRAVRLSAGGEREREGGRGGVLTTEGCQGGPLR